MVRANAVKNCYNQEEGSSPLFHRIEEVVYVSKIWFVAAPRLDNGSGKYQGPGRSLRNNDARCPDRRRSRFRLCLARRSLSYHPASIGGSGCSGSDTRVP